MSKTFKTDLHNADTHSKRQLSPIKAGVGVFGSILMRTDPGLASAVIATSQIEVTT
jgi:hypothetical protein